MQSLSGACTLFTATDTAHERFSSGLSYENGLLKPSLALFFFFSFFFFKYWCVKYEWQVPDRSNGAAGGPVAPRFGSKTQWQRRQVGVTWHSSLGRRGSGIWRTYLVSIPKLSHLQGCCACVRIIPSVSPCRYIGPCRRSRFFSTHPRYRSGWCAHCRLRCQHSEHLSVLPASTVPDTTIRRCSMHRRAMSTAS